MNDQQQGAPDATQRPPSAAGSTSAGRPQATQAEIAAFRMAQSARDGTAAIAARLDQLTPVLHQMIRRDQDRDDQATAAELDARLEAGDITQREYTRQVAERVARTAALETVRPAPPAPPAQPAAGAQQPNPTQLARTFGTRAILVGFGLTGNEPGLDASSPAALVASAARIVGARAGGPDGTLDVPAAQAELARQQGYVIPHRDGGRAVPTQPVTEADPQRIVWDKSLSRGGRIEALKALRTAAARNVPTA